MARFGSRWGSVLRTPVGVSAAALLTAVLLLALLAPLLFAERAAAIDTSQILKGPSSDHWAGTDGLGRDIFTRVLVATRLSVSLALSATAIGVTTGVVLGTAMLWAGARVGRLVTAAVNIAVAFPGLLLALFFAVIFGVGATGALLAIGFATAPGFARLTQTLVARVVGLDYVAAARIAGVGRAGLLARHVLPNVGEPLVVNATIVAGNALLAFAGLSFLGLGVQAPAYDWGRLLGEGLNSIYLNPAAALAPSVAVVVAGLAFNLFGETIARGLGLRTPAVSGRGDQPRAGGAGGADRGGRRRSTRCSRWRACGSASRAGRHHHPGARGHVLGAAGRGRRRRRRVRVGQEPDRAGDRPTHRGARPGAGRPPGVPRHRPARPRTRAHAPAAARHLAGDGVPGPDDLVQPDQAHRRPAGRGGPPAPGARPRAGLGQSSRPPARRAPPGGANARRGSTPTSSPGACGSAR